MTSPNGVIVYGPGASVTDAKGNVYAITSGSKITINGTVDPPSSGVVALAFYNGAVYQKNNSDLWFSQTAPDFGTFGWTNYPAGTHPVPFTPSGDNTVAATGGNLIDSNGDQWSITSGKQVAEDGVADPLTNRVVEIAYVKGFIWQENTDDLWYQKTAQGWGSGTPTSPLPGITRTWLGGGNEQASNPADWSPTGVPQPGDQLFITGSLNAAPPNGTINVAGNDLAGDTLTVGSVPTHSIVTINLSNNATLSLDSLRQGLAVIPQTTTVNVNGDATIVADTLNNPESQTIVINSGTLTLDALNATGNIGISNTGTSRVMISGGTLNLQGKAHNDPGSTIDIAAAVTGAGTFDDAGPLTFHKQVAATVAVDVNASTATLEIDQPTDFLGKVNLTKGVVNLVNQELFSADSYGYADNLLTLYAGGKSIDQLHLTTASPPNVERTTGGVTVYTSGTKPPSGTLLPEFVIPPPSPQPPPGVLPLGPPNNFKVDDITTGGSWQSQGHPYAGPVEGITSEIIIATTDKINVLAETKNVFIKTGSGEDAIDVSRVDGYNIMDGSTGSNFLVGGTGRNNYFLDDRNAPQPIWSTLVNFHRGDDATIWGITANDFKLRWVDGEGAVGYKGLTGTFTGGNTSTAVVTLTGLSTADLINGKLSISYGHTSDQSGLPGSDYMLIHAN